jgi:hypothetical protein
MSPREPDYDLSFGEVSDIYEDEPLPTDGLDDQ